ncbi:MAG: GNAT family N-acetyltransferase [Clostridia bacterium]
MIYINDIKTKGKLMEVRPIEAADKETFLAQCKSFYSVGATSRGYDQKLAEKTFDYLMCRHENLWGYMMDDRDSGLPVGYALITSYWCNEEGGNVIILDELYIDSVNRHKGYGKLFLEWIENEFKDRIVSITLEVLADNLIAKDLYHKLGYLEDGFVTMTKRIS